MERRGHGEGGDSEWVVVGGAGGGGKLPWLEQGATAGAPIAPRAADSCLSDSFSKISNVYIF